MGKERLLDEIAQRAGKSLPRDLADALLLEASDHLDAAIAARIELETSPEIAEVEAVAAFGSVAHVVRREIAVRQGRWHAPALALLTVVGGAWLPMTHSGMMGEVWSIFFTPFLLVVAHTALTYACVTRRPRRHLALSIASFALVSVALYTVLCGPCDIGPVGRPTLVDIAEHYQRDADARARREAKYDRLGWPTEELRKRTRQDGLGYARASAAARQAASTVDLPGSARASLVPTLVFAAYLLLLYAFGAWGERLMARGSRWTCWDFWRPE